jgi:transcriptional regulator GlxA family with amidase domain
MRISNPIEQLACELVTPSLHSTPTQVQSILRVIHARLFDETLNVKTLKADCGIGDHNVSTQFKQYVGRSIKEYIEHHRMQTAQRLLRTQGLAVSQIACAVGYPHVQTFYRVFTRHFGRSPGDLREQFSVPFNQPMATS